MYIENDQHIKAQGKKNKTVKYTNFMSKRNKSCYI